MDVSAILVRVASGIMHNAPIWVWPLFVLLIVLGLRETRSRIIHKGVFCLLPAVACFWLACYPQFIFYPSSVCRMVQFCHFLCCRATGRIQVARVINNTESKSYKDPFKRRVDNTGRINGYILVEFC
ncbi:MAG: hypothetical protein ACI9D5_002919 [Candidatus Endobugula sp.]|jgi:hypothetical protein